MDFLLECIFEFRFLSLLTDVFMFSALSEMKKFLDFFFAAWIVGYLDSW